MIRKITFGLILFLIFATSAIAGEANHQKAVLKLLEITNAQKLIDQTLDSINQMVAQQFKSMNLPSKGQEASDRIREEIMTWFSEFFVWEKMQKLYIDIYTDVFTEQEINGLIDFYQTPLGQKMLSKMPELMQKTIQKTQVILKSKTPEFQKRLEKAVIELKEKYK